MRTKGGQNDGADLFREAYEEAAQLGEDALAIDAAHMLGIVEQGEAALHWNLQALDLAQTSKDPKARKWRKSLHNNLGWHFFGSGDYRTAMRHFEACLVASIESGDVESERIARWSIAKTLRVTGWPEEALAIQEILVQGKQDGFVDEEIAECLLALAREPEAKPYFRKAYEQLSKNEWLAGHEPARIQRLKELS